MNECIIASFPRSGSHLVRYLIEIMSGRPTLGEGDYQWSRTVDGPILERLSLIQKEKSYKYKDSNPIGYKRHIIREEDYKIKNLIYIERDMIESILRHALHNHSMDSIFDPNNLYLQTLIKLDSKLNSEYYEKNNFESRIKIIFEDLVFGSVDQIIESLSQIDNILNLKCKSIKTIVKNINKHKENAKLVFHNISFFNENADNPNYWKSKLTKDQLEYLTNLINQNFKDE